MPRFAKYLPLGLLIIFGLPFLLLTDLFPFHRFGMFARMPHRKPEREVKILMASEGKWKQAVSGSPCLDNGALRQTALEAFENRGMESQMLSKILPSLKPQPDSIALETTENQNLCRRIIYPSK